MIPLNGAAERGFKCPAAPFVSACPTGVHIDIEPVCKKAWKIRGGKRQKPLIIIGFQ